jgi:thiosulfate/3-mercaptopyruvate sulfurtransferase
VPELSSGIPADPSPAFAGYANPRRLCSTEWLSANIGNPRVKIVECNEDLMLYAIGHIPGALKLDWRGDLTNPDIRDFVDGAGFAALMRAKGIDRGDTVVLYGDRHNHWAAYAAWVFTLFGHADVRLLDGGRDLWHQEGRETTLEPPWPVGPPAYPAVQRDDKTVRVFADAVRGAIGSTTLLDVRTAAEFGGEPDAGPRHHAGALRRGHIPTARNISWDTALGPDGRFRPAGQLRAAYSALDSKEDVIVYCHTGEQSAHTWFVLTYLLGYSRVRVYDGSWAEWGNAVGTPIAKGQ